MSNKSIQMKQRNAGTWDKLYPLTLIDNVFDTDGTTSLRAHLSGGGVNPDNFVGNDLQKIQAAVDFCSTYVGGNLNARRMIVFSRLFDITGLGSINIPSYDTRTLFIVGVGGGIKKTDAGRIFTSPTWGYRNVWSQNMIFESVAGAGVIVWDCTKLVMVTSMMDNYHQIDCGFDATGAFMQSVRMAFCNVQRGNGYFVTARYTGDCSFVNNVVENRGAFFRNLNDGAFLFAQENVNLRIKDNVFEAMSSTDPVIHIGTNWDSEFIGNYFEANQGISLDMTANANGGAQGTITVANNSFQPTAAQITAHTPSIKWGKCVDDVTSFSNSCTGLLHDIANGDVGVIVSIADKSSTGELITSGKESRIFEVNKIKKRATSWTPTLAWTGANPAAPVVTAKYKVFGNKCKFDIDISSADGNGATGLTITVPVPAYNDVVTHTLSGMQIVGATTSPIVGYYVYSYGFINVKMLPATDGQSLFISVSGEYEIA